MPTCLLSASWRQGCMKFKCGVNGDPMSLAKPMGAAVRRSRSGCAVPVRPICLTRHLPGRCALAQYRNSPRSRRRLTPRVLIFLLVLRQRRVWSVWSLQALRVLPLRSRRSRSRSKRASVRLPVKEDFMELGQNSVLEVCPGIRSRAYVDEVTATPKRNRHTQQHQVAFNTATITASFLKYEMTKPRDASSCWSRSGVSPLKMRSALSLRMRTWTRVRNQIPLSVAW
jgi:hypothetical protein